MIFLDLEKWKNGGAPKFFPRSHDKRKKVRGSCFLLNKTHIEIYPLFCFPLSATSLDCSYVCKPLIGFSYALQISSDHSGTISFFFSLSICFTFIMMIFWSLTYFLLNSLFPFSLMITPHPNHWFTNTKMEMKLNYFGIRIYKQKTPFTWKQIGEPIGNETQHEVGS